MSYLEGTLIICELPRDVILTVAFHALLFLRPRAVQDGLTDPKSGRRFASVTRIPNRGHLVSDIPIDSVTP